MTPSRLSQSLKPLGAALRAAAFDMSPAPALVIGPDGALAAANEALRRAYFGLK